MKMSFIQPSINNIAPEIIGNISNLRFIPAIQNIKRYYEN